MICISYIRYERWVRCRMAAALLLLGIFSAAHAVAEPTEKSALPALKKIEFELPLMTGGWLNSNALPHKPTLINFWHSDCLPCLKELPLLKDYAQQQNKLSIVTVALENIGGARKTLSTAPKQMVVAMGPIDARAMLKRFGNHSGAIPHTVVLRADRTLCRKFTGEITREWIDEATRSCSQ